VLNSAIEGYVELPDFPAEPGDAALRDTVVRIGMPWMAE